MMISKIKAGQRKAKRKKELRIEGNPSWFDPSFIGFAERPLIEKVTGQPYEAVKSKVLDFMVSMILGGIKKP
jgi:hypothetical protein